MIKAEFDGIEREFKIEREYVPFFERSMGRSLYAVLREFTEGVWTFADVAAVISFSLHGPTDDDLRSFGTARHAAKFGMDLSKWNHVTQPDIIAVLERDGHGNHATLAADILSDAIFGPKDGAGDEG